MGKVLRTLARGEVFVVACAWLILLLILGTLAQRNMGLFYAQEKYFSSWVFTLGRLPVPGGRAAMVVIFISLAAYLLRSEIWRWRKAGLLVAHLGAMLLLVGGFLTAYFSQEGTMVIREGETVDYMMDTVRRELALQVDTGDIPSDLAVFPDRELEVGRTLRISGMPVKIELLEYYRNCQVLQRHVPPGLPLRGLARRYRLMPAERMPDPSGNSACATVRLSGAGSNTDGIYGLVENASRPEELEIAERSYLLSLRPARTYLPFRMVLTDFSKVDYPGTTVAKSYESTLDLRDGESSRQVIIAMNEPLRHRGYTFYQSSFFQSSSGETTVLAAVKNHGRIVPYFASLVMCIGLLIHLASLLLRKQSGLSGSSRQEKRRVS